MYEPIVELLETYTEQGFACELCHVAVINCPKYRVSIPLYLGDAYFGDTTITICSVEVHAEEIDAKKKHVQQINPNNYSDFQGVPSQREKHDWIWSFYNHPTYPRDTARSGKWQLFIPCEDIDNAWLQVKGALVHGKLGRLAKVKTISGARPDKLTGNMRQVLIIYSYDWQDTTDTLRILKELRNIGLAQPAYWKSNEDTDAGIYSTNADKVSKYWSPAGKVVLLNNTKGRSQKQS